MDPNSKPFKSFLEALVGPPPPPPKWYERIDWQTLIERTGMALTTVTVVWLSPVYGAILMATVVIMLGLIKIALLWADAYTETHKNGNRDE